MEHSISPGFVREILQNNRITSIETDSRKVGKGALFVPIPGENVDGHRFLEQAAESGAEACLTMRDPSELQKKYPELRLYPVTDSVRALQEIGGAARDSYTGTVIGVTGSVGKTTTREMIACALSSEKTVFQTKGNANSQIGVPITLFELSRSKADCAVIELGMSEFGEMHRIASLAKPDLALITNIGTAHLMNLKSRENILSEKLHILDGMREGGRLLVNQENDLLSALSLPKLREILPYLPGEPELCFYTTRGKATLPLRVPGQHMQENARAALSVCEALGVSLASAAEALSRYENGEGRGRSREVRGMTILDYSYNASPASMIANLRVLSETEGKRRIAVLADMKELGEEEDALHRSVGAAAAPLLIDHFYLYGKLARQIGSPMREKERLSFCGSFETLRAMLQKELCQGDAVLFQGSHSMGLDRMIQELLQGKS